VSVVVSAALRACRLFPLRHRGGHHHRAGGADGGRDGAPAGLAGASLRAVLGRAGCHTVPGRWLGMGAQSW